MNNIADRVNKELETLIIVANLADITIKNINHELRFVEDDRGMLDKLSNLEKALESIFTEGK